MAYYRFDKYKTKANRYECPQCGGKHCLTRYLDGEGKYISSLVGKCDHEQSCGYNYTPQQYYRDNPWEREERMKKMRTFAPKPAEKRKPIYVPVDYMARTRSNESAFVRWLSQVISDSERMGKVLDMYRIGASNDAVPAVIFWQIDHTGSVRDGKLMWYKPDGHRQPFMTWVSSRLKKAGLLMPEDYTTEKCLFGQHLLAEDRDRAVGLVESEKSALVCACLFPELVWVSTGGCGGLNTDKARALRGRRVVVLPDAGESERWRGILETVGAMDYTMADWMDAYDANTDVVDILMDGAKPRYGNEVNVRDYLTRVLTK